MNNTSLIRIPATAGTYFVKTKCTYCHYKYVYRNLFDKSIFLIRINQAFFQVASSAVRPLTNIPHCCTQLPWDFFIPNVVDQPFQLRLREFSAC